MLRTGRCFCTILIAFAAGCFAFFPAAASAEQATQPATYVTAYYFHGNMRCASCKKIEQYSREAMEKFFTKELHNGALQFTPVNTDQPENTHFIQDYQLYTKSLVIVLMKDGKQVKWKNLAKVWQHIRDRDAFHDYVHREVSTFLGEI